MKYQNNKDLAEAQYYLKMLDDFCKSGQVKIPDPTGTAMPWNLKEDPLKDYLIHLFTLKVTIPETGEEVQKFVIFIAAILVLDMLVIDRKAHVVSIKEAGSWTAVWIILALAFADRKSVV